MVLRKFEMDLPKNFVNFENLVLRNSKWIFEIRIGTSKFEMDLRNEKWIFENFRKVLTPIRSFKKFSEVHSKYIRRSLKFFPFSKIF